MPDDNRYKQVGLSILNACCLFKEFRATKEREFEYVNALYHSNNKVHLHTVTHKASKLKALFE